MHPMSFENWKPTSLILLIFLFRCKPSKVYGHSCHLPVDGFSGIKGKTAMHCGCWSCLAWPSSFTRSLSLRESISPSPLQVFRERHFEVVARIPPGQRLRGSERGQVWQLLERTARNVRHRKWSPINCTSLFESDEKHAKQRRELKRQQDAVVQTRKLG